MPGISVTGMVCEHCKQSVTATVASIPGVATVAVDLQKARVDWTDADPANPVSPDRIKEEIRRIGFDIR